MTENVETQSQPKQKSPLAEFMIQRRNELGMNQMDLHAASGLSSGTIASIEAGLSQAPKAETLQKLAKGLRVSYQELDCIVRGLPYRPETLAQDKDPLREFEIYLLNKTRIPKEVAKTLIEMIQMVVKKYE